MGAKGVARKPMFISMQLHSAKMPYMSGTFVLKWEDGLGLLKKPGNGTCEDHVEHGLRVFMQRLGIRVVAYGVMY